MYSPQESAEIQNLRQKAMSNTITPQELRRGIELLRQGRVQAAATSAKSKATKAAKATPVNSDSLLDELGGLS
jgi:hypothetical protein